MVCGGGISFFLRIIIMPSLPYIPAFPGGRRIIADEPRNQGTPEGKRNLPGLSENCFTCYNESIRKFH